MKQQVEKIKINEKEDEVETYFGFRTIENKPFGFV